MSPWFGDAGHRLKTLITTYLSLSRSRFNTMRRRKRQHKRDKVKTNQGLKSTPAPAPNLAVALNPQLQAQFIPNNPITVVQPPSPPTALEFAQPKPTPIPSGGSLTHGLSPLGRPNPPPLLAVHTETGSVHGAQGDQGTRTDTPASQDSECPAARAPRARALLIGVLYHDPDSAPVGWMPLTTPGKDVIKMRKLLHSRGYTEFRTLVDTHDSQRYAMPTDEEIRKGLHWLIDDARPGDKLFLHYSGHGTQEETSDTSESDGMNEAIVPLRNTPSSGETLIIDDELHAILVNPLPQDCTLMAVFDCCHSGTMLDLSHKYPQSRITRRNLQKLWVKDVVARFTRPHRHAHSLPAMKPHRPLTIEVPPPAPEPEPTKPQRNPTRRGTINPLNLQYVYPGATDGPAQIQSFGPVQPFPFGELSRSSTPAQSGMLTPPPTGIFHAEPDSRSSTQGSMQISVPSRHATIHTIPIPTTPTTPPHSHSHPGNNDTASVRWLPGSLASTPRDAAFNHDQIVPPIVKDFMTQPRAHSQVRSPTVEDRDKPRATIIVIAACHDEEEAIDFDNTGGLLTSTFIECMTRPYHRDGVSLVDMVSYFRERFKAEMISLHAHCRITPTPNDGRCANPDCKMPLKAPEPLVTSSIKMMGDARIML